MTKIVALTISLPESIPLEGDYEGFEVEIKGKDLLTDDIKVLAEQLARRMIQTRFPEQIIRRYMKAMGMAAREKMEERWAEIDQIHPNR